MLNQSIYPKDIEFFFMLDSGTCFKHKFGTCSLLLDESEVNQFPDDYKKSSANYCRKISKSIIERGQEEVVKLFKFDCGHLGFTDGQHRTCIAKHLSLSIDAIIDDAGMTCPICDGRQCDAYLG
ncbi:hypothetical protein MHB43_23805 [Paenibacillus sp. FSL H8-0317]|uniref:hypothetical protein n=1 Tax=Paenibacillus sp. FSL H8-0317 TaxID=2921385 RepID=UPI003251E851